MVYAVDRDLHIVADDVRTSPLVAVECLSGLVSHSFAVGVIEHGERELFPLPPIDLRNHMPAFSA